MKLTGQVKAGKFVADNPAAWPIAMREYEGKRVTVEIETQRYLRSLKANARYWGVLVPLAKHFLSASRDIPLSKDQTHYVLASAFLGCDETPLGPVPMKTSLLDTKQFADYCTRVEVWLAESGYPIPESEDSEDAA